MLGKTALERLINSNLLIRFRVVVLYMPLDYSYSKTKPRFFIFHSGKKNYLIFKITKNLLVDLDNEYYKIFLENLVLYMTVIPTDLKELLKLFF